MPYKEWLVAEGAQQDTMQNQPTMLNSPFLTRPQKPANISWVSNIGPMMKLWWTLMAINGVLIIGLLFFAG